MPQKIDCFELAIMLYYQYITGDKNELFRNN